MEWLKKHAKFTMLAQRIRILASYDAKIRPPLCSVPDNLITRASFKNLNVKKKKTQKNTQILTFSFSALPPEVAFQK